MTKRSLSGQNYLVSNGLEQFSIALAAQHQEVAQPKLFPKLLPRLQDNEKVLIASYHEIAEAIRKKQAISPAAEWLVDNFHIVEEQLREIRQDLPKSFYRQLPKLRGGDFTRFPRIYAVAVAIVAHTDSHLEVDTLNRFLKAYQSVTPLKIGELWAAPITLRLTLVENLRRLAERIVLGRKEREAADQLTDTLFEIAIHQPDELLSTLKKHFGKQTVFGHAYIAQVARRLRDQDPAFNPVIGWFESKLNLAGESIEQIVQSEHQRQAATQITVGNIITSMRLLSTLDWQNFFENVSVVDPILCKDPSGVYLQMDFKTRDRYRDVIEKIARRTRSEETDVAEYAVDLAASVDASELRRSHIGYYLIDNGVEILKKSFGYRPTFFEAFQNIALKNPTFAYIGTILFLTIGIVVLLVEIGDIFFSADSFELIILALLSLVPASDLAIGLVNLDVSLTFPPRVLPKKDFKRLSRKMFKLLSSFRHCSRVCPPFRNTWNGSRSIIWQINLKESFILRCLAILQMHLQSTCHLTTIFWPPQRPE